MLTWIYTPTTGSRLFISKLSVGIQALVTWACGSMHVLHEGVQLSWASADPGEWWRDTCTAAIKACPCPVIGWDENGVIHAIVPIPAAREVVRWLTAVKTASQEGGSNHELVIQLAELRSGSRKELDPGAAGFWFCFETPTAAISETPLEEKWPQFKGKNPECIQYGRTDVVTYWLNGQCKWVGSAGSLAGAARSIAWHRAENGLPPDEGSGKLISQYGSFAWVCTSEKMKMAQECTTVFQDPCSSADLSEEELRTIAGREGVMAVPKLDIL